MHLETVLLRVMIVALLGATLCEVSLLAAFRKYREDAYQAPMLIALLWTAWLKLQKLHVNAAGVVVDDDDDPAAGGHGKQL